MAIKGEESHFTRLPVKKTEGLNGFLKKLYQMLTEEILVILTESPKWEGFPE